MLCDTPACGSDNTVGVHLGVFSGSFVFVLVGVRISAFVTSDDKQPQQRSIISFLQPGKTDSDGCVKVKQQKPEREHLSSGSVQTGSVDCCPPTQKQEDVPWQSKKRGLEDGQTGEEPQLSFFQRAHAKRLQLQVAGSSTEVEGNRENPPVITSVESDGENTVEPSTDAGTNRDSDLVENDLEAKASTSGCGASVSKSFTCPVCFRQVETTI